MHMSKRRRRFVSVLPKKKYLRPLISQQQYLTIKIYNFFRKKKLFDSSKKKFLGIQYLHITQIKQESYPQQQSTVDH